jgi:hypothetical protein
MSCWPPCSAWCECIDNTCRPTPVTINAVRFSMPEPDGRHLQAANGGGGLMVAANVIPQTSETFLFVAAFSARGVTREGIVEAAKEDYRALIEANAGLLCLREEGDRQRSA